MPRISRKGGTKPQTAVTTPKKCIWKCAVYARLSVEDSGRKGADTIETQIDLVASYVTQHHDLSLADTYIDNGVSGKNLDRPSWLRLMDDIRAGRVNCVCVKDLSRFSRNYIETCEFLEKIFPFMGVRFVSINDGYDSNSPSSTTKSISPHRSPFVGKIICGCCGRIMPRQGYKNLYHFCRGTRFNFNQGCYDGCI